MPSQVLNETGSVTRILFEESTSVAKEPIS